MSAASVMGRVNGSLSLSKGWVTDVALGLNFGSTCKRPTNFASPSKYLVKQFDV